jgi:purine-binding chemotaxis protein CheW
MSERLVLLVAIAGRTVAIAAADVGSVIEIADITPVPRVAPHVRGLHALRSQVLTVVDARIAVGAEPAPAFAVEIGIVLHVDGHGYALIVDAVLDVVAATAPMPAAVPLPESWARVAIGRVTIADEVVLLVSPAALIEAPERRAA